MGLLKYLVRRTGQTHFKDLKIGELFRFETEYNHVHMKANHSLFVNLTASCNGTSQEDTVGMPMRVAGCEAGTIIFEDDK